MRKDVSSFEGMPSFDLCLSDGATPPKGTASVCLLEEEIVVAVPAEHPLADRNHVSLQELKEESFITLPPGKSSRETTDAFCRLAGFTPASDSRATTPPPSAVSFERVRASPSCRW